MKEQNHPHRSWSLVGYDAFSSEWYPLDGHYATEAKALDAAHARLRDLERTQPSADSGGQGFGGIQDRVYVRIDCAQCGYPQRRVL